ncbi:hypothetical protein EVAR_30689_1 [Eumeta japonica]|uniref:Uncharacterized protein n=1 Tax=Eumeta variegata TaxID=151549 RepID=A0A4C1VRF9_EUMVA|nr:hypothetical protein EVAR_30689_1 [Eumeta japonica]
MGLTYLLSNVNPVHLSSYSKSGYDNESRPPSPAERSRSRLAGPRAAVSDTAPARGGPGGGTDSFCRPCMERPLAQSSISYPAPIGRLLKTGIINACADGCKRPLDLLSEMRRGFSLG